jgi:hypothetical protein
MAGPRRRLAQGLGRTERHERLKLRQPRPIGRWQPMKQIVVPLRTCRLDHDESI